jgi:hypothetical protein
MPSNVTIPAVINDDLGALAHTLEWESAGNIKNKEAMNFLEVYCCQTCYMKGMDPFYTPVISE